MLLDRQGPPYLTKVEYVAAPPPAGRAGGGKHRIPGGGVTWNRSIRFAHRLTFGRLLLVAFTYRLTRRQPRVYAEWLAALNTIPDDNVKKRLLAFSNDYNWIVAKHIITGNPLPLFCVSVLSLISSALDGFQSAVRVASRPIVDRISKLEDQMEEDDAQMLAGPQAA